MGALHVRLVLGLLLMAVACCTAFRRGDRVVRQAAILISACWVSAAALQLITRLRSEPVIAGDVACAIGLLAIGWSTLRGWLCAMICIQAGLLILHVDLYQAHQALSAAEVLGNNLLSAAGLIVLVGAAFGPRQARYDGTQGIGPQQLQQ